jgi:hypothetical protein
MKEKTYIYIYIYILEKHFVGRKKGKLKLQILEFLVLGTC